MNYKNILIFFILSFIGLNLPGQENGFEIPEEPGETVPDSLDKKITSWKLVNFSSNVLEKDMDTTLTGFQHINKQFNKKKFPSYLGPLGSPGISTNYFLRERSEFFFLQHYLPYTLQSGEQLFINTKSPFTEFAYSSGGGTQSMEQHIKLIHTQNINPMFNAGFQIRAFSADGQYSYQKGKDISFSFFSSYQGENYSIYGSIGINKIRAEENGGLSNDSTLQGNRSGDVPTGLGSFNEASSWMNNKYIGFSQHFSVGKFKGAADSLGHAIGAEEGRHLARLVHNFKLEDNARRYTDMDPASGYYRNIYIDSAYTYDSTYYRTLTNSLILNLQSNPDRKFRLGLSVGLRNEITKFSRDIIPDFTPFDNPVSSVSLPGISGDLYLNGGTYIWRKDENFINTALLGRLVNDMGKGFGWEAQGEIYFQGYKAGNIDVGGRMFKEFGKAEEPAVLEFGGRFRNERPVYWLNHYASNNFAWENDLNFENELRGRAALSIPAIGFDLSADAAIITNKCFFDSLALPDQKVSALSVFSVLLKKNIKLWKFRMDNDMSFQYSSDDYVLPLPLFAFRNSTYLEHDFYFKRTDGKLLVQLGLDLYYHTRYYANAYMPSSGRFFAQQEKMIGNYPFMDAFLNFRVKRTRVFFKLEHFASGKMGYDFFTVPHYPANQVFFTMGFSWTFYD